MTISSLAVILDNHPEDAPLLEDLLFLPKVCACAGCRGGGGHL